MAELKRSVGREEFWRRLLVEQGRCGLSIRAFCRQKAISEPSFYAWRKRLRRPDVRGSRGRGSSGRLIPVDVIRATRERSTGSSHETKKPLEIRTPSGFRLRFDRDADPETIAQLLGVISQCVPGGTASC